MRIKVSENVKSTGNSSTTQDFQSNNLLSAFPCSDILNQIYCDHIYSSAFNINQTRYGESETPEEDRNDSSESSDDIDIEIPRNPRVITKLIKVPTEIETQRPDGEVSRLHNSEAQSCFNDQSTFSEIDGKLIKSEHKGNKTVDFEEDVVAKQLVRDKTQLEHTKVPEGYETSTTEDSDRRLPVQSEIETEKHVNEDRHLYNFKRVNKRDSISDNDMISLNAETIQKVFQSMICMTSLTPITDVSNHYHNNVSSRATTEEREEEDDATDKAKREITKVNGSNKNIPSKPFTIYDHGLDKKGQMCVKLRMECNTSPSTSGLTTQSKQESAHGSSTCDSAKPTLSATSNNKYTKTIKQDKRKRSQTLRKSSYSTGNNSLLSEKRTVPLESETPAEDVKNSKLNYQTVNDKAFKEISKEIESDIEMCMKIKYTLELLIKKWGEYLVMTDDQIRAMEVQNARDFDMVDEVIEMLEDKDRYVWELINDLNFCWD